MDSQSLTDLKPDTSKFTPIDSARESELKIKSDIRLLTKERDDILDDLKLLRESKQAQAGAFELSRLLRTKREVLDEIKKYSDVLDILKNQQTERTKQYDSFLYDRTELLNSVARAMELELYEHTKKLSIKSKELEEKERELTQKERELDEKSAILEANSLKIASKTRSVEMQAMDIARTKEETDELNKVVQAKLKETEQFNQQAEKELQDILKFIVITKNDMEEKLRKISETYTNLVKKETELNAKEKTLSDEKQRLYEKNRFLEDKERSIRRLYQELDYNRRTGK